MRIILKSATSLLRCEQVYLAWFRVGGFWVSELFPVELDDIMRYMDEIEDTK